MGNHPVSHDLDPQQLADSAALWKRFTSFATVGTIAIAVLLSLMALFLV
ncbi:MAG: aa3-type cytochrome c oxidase subunit IV [Micavibrio sp.]